MHRNTTIDTLVQKYRSIGPLLVKMESLVVNTNTGRSAHMKSYYAHWERKIYNALVTVRIRLKCWIYGYR